MTEYIDLGPEMFTDGKVICYKGEYYYRSCDAFVCHNREGGQSFCVKRVGHPSMDHEAYDGTKRYEEFPARAGRVE